MNQEEKLDTEELDKQLGNEIENASPEVDTNVEVSTPEEDKNESESGSSTENQPKDLEAFFKEHRNNEEQYEVRKYGGVIVFLALIAVGLGGYIFFDKFLKIEKTVSADEEQVEPVKEKEAINVNNVFSYHYYDLALPKLIDSSKDIYYIYIKTEDYINFDIYGRYTNGNEVLIANIKCKDKIELDYRVLDVDNSKLYFVIHSKEKGNRFEVDYIDLNNLSLGAKELINFNEVYKKENIFKVNGVDTYYPSQIYVKDDDIFYTSYIDKSIKKYNTRTEKNETLIKDIVWTDYFIDKRNSYIFYLNKKSKLYLTDLSGNNPINLKNVKYSSSNFWLKSYYNNKPIFGFDNGSMDSVDMNIYNYKNGEFIKIQENANWYNIKYNNIDMKATNDSKIIGYLYIA